MTPDTTAQTPPRRGRVVTPEELRHLSPPWRFTPSTDIGRAIMCFLVGPLHQDVCGVLGRTTAFRVSSNYDVVELPLGASADKIYLGLAQTVLSGVEVRAPDGNWLRPYVATGETHPLGYHDRVNPLWEALVRSWAAEVAKWVKCVRECLEPGPCPCGSGSLTRRSIQWSRFACSACGDVYPFVPHPQMGVHST